jgi:hypothetical protein
VSVVAYAAVIIACIGPVLLILAMRLRLRREFGSFFADYRRHPRTVQLPIAPRDADGLCHRALRAVVGHSESERRGPDRFECAGMGFRLLEEAGGTMITITGSGDGPSWVQAMYPRNVRAGRERVDAVAEWLSTAPLDQPLAEDHPSYRNFDVY